jgi:hypothetical protein
MRICTIADDHIFSLTLFFLLPTFIVILSNF